MSNDIKTLQSRSGIKVTSSIHPAWTALIRHCQAMGFGEIERIKIQDGVPVLIERSVEKIKLP